MEILRNAFAIKKVKVDSCEITMYQFVECLLEGKRRDFVNYSRGIAEKLNLWIYYDYYDKEAHSNHFDFKEKIISENDRKQNTIYDENFLKELSNIEEHENISEYKGNIVHYIISSRSVEAAGDMTETLMQSLIKARRISSRRMGIISGIEPDLYKINNHLEEIIENSYGGVIVFDLSEKFGYEQADILKI